MNDIPLVQIFCCWGQINNFGPVVIIWFSNNTPLPLAKSPQAILINSTFSDYIINKTMTTFINWSSRYQMIIQTNIDKYWLAANITEYHIISKLIFLRIIIPQFIEKRQLFHVKMSKINKFKMEVWICWAQLSRWYAFYIVPDCIRNLHTKFEINRTILTYLN